GIAYGARQKGKDAYDLYTLARYHGSAGSHVAQMLQAHAHEPGLVEGMKSICHKFRSLEAEGPADVVNFISPASTEEEARLRQDAFMTMSSLCSAFFKERPGN